ncbi:hypothetical protein I3843_15G065200 [Carya illinoinensis]|uniref:Secreted peptide n=1 Tax=Carya illinoinensis TaxID=32201 RepID=A0A922AB49_CARIL|nr:hypothetical protein I3760_15G067200 [Carya illinoinensis]KAG6674853.1 hypothetical protein I3842_15G067600 [Carya illinoinensis]KAG7943834.1 hypothetical protein I3843_15G065200 [Carya illinoinensis]
MLFICSFTLCVLLSGCICMAYINNPRGSGNAKKKGFELSLRDFVRFFSFPLLNFPQAFHVFIYIVCIVRLHLGGLN